MMKIKICIIIIISCYLTQITVAKCPSADVMLPCKCNNEEISCGGNDDYSLKNVFILISGALKEEEKNFKQFYFNNTAIQELVINVFYDITFESIVIDSAHNLTQINTHAFLSTNQFVKIFSLHNTPYGNNNTLTDNNNIFNALNAMINVEYIYISDTSVTSIPSNAFTVLNKLKTLFISNNRNLKSVGVNAFYELNNLTQLDLSYNAFDRISGHAFSFRNLNPNLLTIYLGGMPNLTSNSFSIDAFSSVRRQFILRLDIDFGLKHLDENIFGIVLAGDGNRIELYGTPLECDCRLYWLYENKTQFRDTVWNAICTDGNSVFDDRQSYADCKH